MNIISKNEVIENHRKMWNWIADETLRMKRKIMKEEYFDAMGISYRMRPLNECYCCEYTNRECCLCPLEWIKSCSEELRCIGIYSLWSHSNYYEDAAVYARMIAELPERE